MDDGVLFPPFKAGALLSFPNALPVFTRFSVKQCQPIYFLTFITMTQHTDNRTRHVCMTWEEQNVYTITQ